VPEPVSAPVSKGLGFWTNPSALIPVNWTDSISVSWVFVRSFVRFFPLCPHSVVTYLCDRLLLFKTSFLPLSCYRVECCFKKLYSFMKKAKLTIWNVFFSEWSDNSRWRGWSFVLQTWWRYRKWRSQM
jgi:hypothetical protein